MKCKSLNNSYTRLIVALMLGGALLLTGSNSAWAGNHWGHGHRDKEVVYVKELPHGYRTVHVKKHKYYVHNDHYYRYEKRGYIRCAPPVGAMVATVPVGAVRFDVGGSYYYRHNDNYYRPVNQGYLVVDAPIGRNGSSLHLGIQLFDH